MTVEPLAPSDCWQPRSSTAELAPLTAGDWTVPASGLDWDVRTTVEHLVDMLGFYTPVGSAVCTPGHIAAKVFGAVRGSRRRRGGRRPRPARISGLRVGGGTMSSTSCRATLAGG